MATAKTTGVWVGRSSRFWVLSLAALVLGSWAPPAKAQTCDQTLSVGANVASAVFGAANGTTICLNAGNYGSVQLEDISRTGFVTVRAVTGATVTMSPIVDNSSFIRLQGMRFNGAQLLSNASHHIEFIDDTWVPNGEGIALNGLNDNPPATPQEIIFDGCDFTNVSIALWDGRLNVRGMNGVKIRNSIFAGSTNPGEKSDGIMLIGQSRNTEIGPGNVFHDFHQEDAQQGEHIDAIQAFGAGTGNRIFGNYFYDSDAHWQASDGSTGVTMEHNVFDQTDRGAQIKFRSAVNLVFRHNTIVGTVSAPILENPESGGGGTFNALVENNIFTDGAALVVNDCSGCTIDNNMFSSGGVGTDVIVGTPTFVGGATPTAYVGFALATGSDGENAGNDGLDVGIVLDGEPPPPPTLIETPVNIGTGSSKAGSTVSVTTTAAVPAGATVFVVLGEKGALVDDEPRPTAKDPSNGVYELDLYDQSHTGGTNLAVFRFSNSVALPSGTIITVTVCSTDLAKAVTAFYVESDTPLVLDKSTSEGSSASSTSAATGNITTSTDDQFLLGVGVVGRNDRVVTQDADFLSTVTSSETTGDLADSNREVFIGDRIITAAETNNYGVTFDANTGWVIGLISYKLQ